VVLPEDSLDRANFVASGVYTVLGVMPHIKGGLATVSLLTEGLKGVVNASFAVEPDPSKAAGTGCLCPEYTLLSAILRHIPLLPDHVIVLDTPRT